MQEHHFPNSPDARPLPLRAISVWHFIIDKHRFTLVHLYKDAFVIARRHLLQHGCRAEQLREEAEDVTQAAFERLLIYVPRHVEELEEQLESPEVLLMGFIRNIWHERLRDRARFDAVNLEEVDLSDLADDTDLVTDGKITADLLQEVVFTALDQDLRPECRQLLDLAYVDDYSWQSIGAEMNRNVATVKKQLNRCRKYLLAAAKYRFERLDRA